MSLTLTSPSDFKNVYHFSHNKLSLALATKFFLTIIGQCLCAAEAEASGNLSCFKDVATTTNYGGLRQQRLRGFWNAVVISHNEL